MKRRIIKIIRHKMKGGRMDGWIVVNLSNTYLYDCHHRMVIISPTVFQLIGIWG